MSENDRVVVSKDGVIGDKANGICKLLRGRSQTTVCVQDFNRAELVALARAAAEGKVMILIRGLLGHPDQDAIMAEIGENIRNVGF